MAKVTSKDGTEIAFDRTGNGPALILVDGAFGSRKFGPNESLAPLMAEHFTVYTYDRRGRGESGDTGPYTVEREIEDLEAVIKEAGGSAHVYGISSGAALTLEAADHGLGITKLAVYEAPFVVDESRPPVPDYVEQLNELIAADRRGDVVKIFMKQGVGIPGIFVAMMPMLPAWKQLKAVAHTLPYDATVLGDTGKGKPFAEGKWAAVTVPTLVIDGGKSQAWIRTSMQALADHLPNAKHATLDKQTHIVKAPVLAPVLIEFFRG